MSDLKEGVDYTFVIPEDEGLGVNMRILSGKFEDVVYNYGKVQFNEIEGSEEAELSFEYTVVESNGTDLEDDEEFKNFIGDILCSIIIKNMNEENKGDVVY